MILNRFILFTIISTIIVGCRSADNTNRKHIELSDKQIISITNADCKVIDIESAKILDSDSLLERIKNISYLLLRSEQPIGEIRKLLILDDKIIIMDASAAKTIMVFSVNGSLLYKIKHSGRGPNEYISLWDFSIDSLNNQIVIDDADNHKLVHYSLNDGSFIKKSDNIPNTYCQIMQNVNINMLSNGQDFNKEEDWNIVVSDNDSVLYKGFPMQPIQLSDFIVNSFTVGKSGNLLYTPVYSDTVYSFNSCSSAVASYVIKQPKSIWNLKDDFLQYDEISNLIKDKNYTKFFGKFFQTNTWSYFGVSKRKSGGIVTVPYFYNEISGEVIMWNLTKPSVIRNLIPETPMAVRGNKFYGAFSAIGIYDAFGSNLSDDLVSVLKSSSSEYDIILVSCEIE